MHLVVQGTQSRYQTQISFEAVIINIFEYY